MPTRDYNIHSLESPGSCLAWCESYSWAREKKLVHLKEPVCHTDACQDNDASCPDSGKHGTKEQKKWGKKNAGSFFNWLAQACEQNLGFYYQGWKARVTTASRDPYWNNWLLLNCLVYGQTYIATSTQVYTKHRKEYSSEHMETTNTSITNLSAKFTMLY